MKPESNESRDERNEREAIARAYREASDAVDERPDPHVRAAVLATAARAVDAKPHDAARPAATHPFAARRWPLSLAALLVVSIMTGLVVTHGWWERPDLVDANHERRETPQASAEARADAPAKAPAQASVQAVAPSISATQSAGMIGSQDIDANQGRRATREPDTKSAGSPRRAPRVASPEIDAKVAREAPTAIAPDLAAGISSGITSKKSEMPATNSAPAASALAPAPAQRSFSQSPEMQAGMHVDTPADAGARMDARAKARSESQVEIASPEAWVERIVKLREAGDDDEADREVARLKQRYPTFTIPREALRPLGTR